MRPTEKSLIEHGAQLLCPWPDGQERLIEVKTTNGWERTPFYISRNELAIAEERRSEWRMFH